MRMTQTWGGIWGWQIFASQVWHVFNKIILLLRLLNSSTIQLHSHWVYTIAADSCTYNSSSGIFPSNPNSRLIIQLSVFVSVCPKNRLKMF